MKKFIFTLFALFTTFTFVLAQDVQPSSSNDGSDSYFFGSGDSNTSGNDSFFGTEGTDSNAFADDTWAEPAAEDAVAEPVVENTVAEPVAEDATADPFAEEVAAEPVAEEVAAEPVAEDAAAESVTEDIAAEPSAEEVESAENEVTEPAAEEVADFSVAEESEPVSNERKGAHPYKLEENVNKVDETAHWSIILHAGFSSFDGDFTSEMKHNVAVPSVGLGLEYAFTPVWGVGVEYMYDMYTVTGKPNAQNADTLLNGHMHKAGAYLSMDIFNLFFPRLKKKICSIHPYVGGGVAFYKRNKYYRDDNYYDAQKGVNVNPTHVRGNTIDYVNDQGLYGADFDTAYNNIGYLQAGVNVEFNLNRTLALGVRANYSYFTRDYVDGRGYSKNPRSNASKNNDGIFDVTLNMRFKLEAVSKSHVRNLVSFDNLEEAPKALDVHDTLIIQHDTTIIREIYNSETKELEQYYYVYFENNKADINDKGLITIQQVAERLQEDSTLYAIVTGYCDNTGSDQLNYALGDRRADNVMDELVAEHGIDAERMYASGMGKVIGGRSKASYSPNRRASIRLVDKATFDRMKLNMDDQRATRANYEEPEMRTIPLSESSRPKKVNTYKLRESETVVTERSTTLSKLAREYYDNTYCWVYIYIANKDKISNPNALKPGIELTIPELTEEEMRITKDQGLVLFQNAKRN